MNTKQKKILKMMIAIIVGMLLCPPHVVTLSGTVYNVGYGLIIDPPKLEFGDWVPVVNVGLLLTQWLGVLLVGGLALFLTKEPTDGSLSSNVVSASTQTNREPQEPREPLN